MTIWAGQNPVDRAIGEAWERQFEDMAKRFGWPCHRPDAPEVWWPDKGLLPDRVVQHDETTEWHELKHKRPTFSGEYGLEAYRYEALQRLERHTGDPVLYTIHDWDIAGAKSRDEDMGNHLEDWFTLDIARLDEHPPRVAEQELTYRNSSRTHATICYWPADLWEPLAWQWGMDAEDKSEERELREIWWAIVKDGKGMDATGHAHAVRWARAGLGLDK